MTTFCTLSFRLCKFSNLGDNIYQPGWEKKPAIQYQQISPEGRLGFRQKKSPRAHGAAAVGGTYDKDLSPQGQGFSNRYGVGGGR